MQAGGVSPEARPAGDHTMPHQPNLFSPKPGEVLPEARQPGRREPGRDVRTPSPGRPQAGPSAWLRRTELLVRVIVRLYLGLLIIALPWLRFWTENGLFSYTDSTAYLAGSGFVRGVVSGLGVLNVAIAMQELFAPPKS